MGETEQKRILAKSIKSRLRRIEGQLKGIEKMIDQESGCTDILIQISAVRAATSKVGVMILENHLRECLGTALQEEGADKDAAIADLMNLVNNFIR